MYQCLKIRFSEKRFSKINFSQKVTEKIEKVFFENKFQKNFWKKICEEKIFYFA